MKKLIVFLLSLIVALAGCGLATPVAPTQTPWVIIVTPTPPEFAPVTAPIPTAEASTAESGPGIVITAQMGTAIVITAEPGGGTFPPFPTAAPPTPIPPLPSGGSPTELKYILLGQYPDLFFCDPDEYPVARGDEGQRAIEVFPELQANQEEFQAILRHNGLGGLTSFTDDQKLLIYRQHKRLAAILFTAAGEAYQFQLRIAPSGQGQGFAVKGLIDANGTITEQERQPTFATCPICLAAHTLIDTPSGPVAVEDLRAGVAVWTVDSSGARVIGTLLKTVRVPVPTGHPMAHIALDDGRELWASPGHPTTDGRSLGALRPGDLLDGARVILAERVAYDGDATYDLLPSGGTGFYWANGILVGSTLMGSGQ